MPPVTQRIIERRRVARGEERWDGIWFALSDDGLRFGMECLGLL
jgi:hypothetical protein